VTAKLDAALWTPWLIPRCVPGSPISGWKSTRASSRRRKDVARVSLRTADRDVPLRPKAFEVLRYLIENTDRLVTKDELIQAIWPNVIVTDEALTHCVSEARKAIGDGGQAIIKTVPRRGYRFAAAVTQTVGNAEGPPSPAAEVKGAPSGPEAGRGLIPELPLPDKPSIAVLPFSNMNGNPQEDYFAEGMAEEIITALTRCAWLLVIARNSSFTYKGKVVDVRHVGRELGVRYVLEGSVRRAGNRLRFTGQLIDCPSGVHIWADRFEGTTSDVFDLQDLFTASVVAAIEPKMQLAEIERRKHKPTANLDAFDLFLRAQHLSDEFTEESLTAALRHLEQALAIDSTYAASMALAQLVAQGWTQDLEAQAKAGLPLASRAIELGRDDGMLLDGCVCSSPFAIGCLARQRTCLSLVGTQSEFGHRLGDGGAHRIAFGEFPQGVGAVLPRRTAKPPRSKRMVHHGGNCHGIPP
jgi:TolB-like protein/DNA-binding winged helix-turn-helix (wHTH) protein